MRFLHTADLHLGQIMYQNYGREDEHAHFFEQLVRWCDEYRPNALLVSGDIFDIQQPGASTKQAFNHFFVDIHRRFPEMRIVITAGNHDSASRIQADNVLWQLGNVTLIGRPPSSDCMLRSERWQEEYVVRLDGIGYIVALPYMVSPKREVLQSLLDYVADENSFNLPVVMMGHQAVTGADPTGHNFDIGHIQTLNPVDLGVGYDYLALGHIHRPQTINHPGDEGQALSSYPSGVIRYSGSALHVSCDEQYPHSVSMVEIDRHGGTVQLKRLRIAELRHFYEIPSGNSAQSSEEALDAVRSFVREYGSGYFRLKIQYDVMLPADFNQQVYQLLEEFGNEVRYNPKIIWTDQPQQISQPLRPVFEVADLQQMVDPVQFVERTINHYPGLDLDDIKDAFKEIEAERQRIREERISKK